MGKPANLNQTSFRGRDDDGSESAATWKAAANTNFSQNVDETFRIRFLITETNGGTESSSNLRLQYNLGGAGWNAVSTGSSVVKAVDSTNLTDDGDTTQQIGSGSFITPNAGVCEDGLAAGVAWAANEECEFEFALQIDSADVNNNDTIQLRMVYESGPTALDSYTNTPTITVVESVTEITHSGINAAAAFGTSLLELNIDTTGLDAPAAFGTQEVYKGTLEPTSIDAAAAFGTHVLTLEIQATGLDTPAAFGDHTIAAAGITGIGLDAPAAFGTHVLTLEVQATGLSTTAAFGTQTLEHNINGTGLSTSTSFGSVTLEHNINATGLDTPAAFGDHTLAQAGITGIGLEAPSAFGDATLMLEVQATGLDTPTVFGTHVLTLEIQGTGLDVPAAFGTPDLELNINAVGLDAPEIFGTFLLLMEIEATGLDAASSFGTAALSQATIKTITASGLLTTTEFGAQTVDVRIITMGAVQNRVVSHQDQWTTFDEPVVSYEELAITFD